MDCKAASPLRRRGSELKWPAAADHPNPRLIKIHRNYSVDEAARRLGVHKNTVRRWPKSGLERVEGKGLTIFRGPVLRAFLEERRQKAKTTQLAWAGCSACGAEQRRSPPARGRI